jgi:hypothetical protein
LLAGVYGLGLCVACSCMAGSTAKSIYCGLIGILGEGWNFGTKVDWRMMIVTVGASEMCD